MRLEPYAVKAACSVPRGEGGRKAILLPDWLKCILGCEHWLAESPQGVAIQVYCALIASVLLALWSGRRPTKRAMEALRFYQLGLADDEELELLLHRAKML